MKSRSSSAFTLIELLIVIGVVAILASVLFPAYKKGIAGAQQAKCSNNLRQLVSGWSLLCSDLGNSVKYQYKEPSSKNWGWVGQLESYIPTKDLNTLLLCPSAATRKTGSGDFGTATASWQYVDGVNTTGSYGINACWYSNMNEHGWSVEPYRSWIIGRPGNAGGSFPVIADSVWVDAGPDMAIPQDFEKGERWMVARHQGKGINIGFSDGSVRFASLGELARDIKMFPGDTVPRTSLYNQIPEKYR